MGCHHGEYLVQGSHATRQSHDDVALGYQQVLAVAQIVTGNLYIQVGKLLATALHERGHHTYRHATMVLHRLAYALHQADVAAAEYQRMPVVSHPPPHFLGCREEVGVYVVVGRTENSNFHNAFCRCIY